MFIAGALEWATVNTISKYVISIIKMKAMQIREILIDQHAFMAESLIID